MSEVYLAKDKLEIFPEQKVLDVGCGDTVEKMFRMETVNVTYVDKVIPENYSGNNFIQLDLEVQTLPFDDKTFDYIICAHVLEHLRDPFKVVDEINRVGKAGYVGSPSIFTEIFWNWDEHKWMIIPVGDVLYFVWKRRSFVTKFGDFFHKACVSNINFNRMRMEERNLQLMYTRFIWKDELKVKEFDLENIHDIFDLFKEGS